MDINVGNTYNLDEVAVWHYYPDGRTYYDNYTYVSSNNTDWVLVIANTDAETPNGKRFNRWQQYSPLVTCSAGTYLGAGDLTCTTCPAGSACPGGTYGYDSENNSGITQCAAGKYSTSGATSCTNCVAGSYSAAGASACTVCPNGKTNTAGSSSCSANCSNATGVSTWETPTWNSNNTITNYCVVNTCGSGYHINGNACASNDKCYKPRSGYSISCYTIKATYCCGAGTYDSKYTLFCW